ncbi:Small auxin-up RNA [Dillenia turbinata]|uniref:Small auxin-up RNA n=1 Tax=Dillenia turbinata TaxID=194707 RepID=A0AAN8VRW2_9MAGN
MISTKKFIALAKKWRKKAGTGSRPKSPHGLADTGHFVVYSMDRTRLVVPLTCLRSKVFIELLKMSEKEFGLPSDGPIKLPCDVASVECIVLLLIQRSVPLEREHSLLAVNPDEMQKSKKARFAPTG